MYQKLLGVALGIAGIAIIIFKLGWLVGLGIFLLFWGHNNEKGHV